MTARPEALDRILDAIAGCFTPEFAHRLAKLKADADIQARLDVLAAKANEGQLTDEEAAEYRRSIDILDVLAILQAKARAYLRAQSST